MESRFCWVLVLWLSSRDCLKLTGDDKMNACVNVVQRDFSIAGTLVVFETAKFPRASELAKMICSMDLPEDQHYDQMNFYLLSEFMQMW